MKPDAAKSQPLAKVPTTNDKVHEVFNWILSGASQHDIEQAIAATFPGSKPKPLIVEAMARVMEAAEADSNVVRGWAIEATRSIYQKSMEVGDHQTALRALRQIIDLSDK